ncbi:TetR/AcrR family transcriptional regulator [Phenylobacterium sp.]|uniref:TetR/AcrR family transcriptional regulator n=1 Tax=Phenylobacterium sp. TaxID=1871053 RepID=UPI0025F55780|nr:TetR/AcrR family transcriptional regulator [Phenylobacterium sp.]
MAKADGKRVRRTVEASRQAILEAAEAYLAAEGPNGVKVQKIAAELNMTDAAIHYHFGNREGLLEALLRFSGRRFADELQQIVAQRAADGLELAQVGELLTEFYAGRGTARLALWLVLTGWSPSGQGMLLPMAERVHAARVRRAEWAGQSAPELAESQKLVALVAAVTLTQALAGDANLRAVGLSETSPKDFLDWTIGRLDGRQA